MLTLPIAHGWLVMTRLGRWPIFTPRGRPQDLRATHGANSKIAASLLTLVVSHDAKTLSKHPQPFFSDLAEWLRAQGGNVSRQVNDLVRFYMDTSLATERGYQTAWEPGEMQEPEGHAAPPPPL